MQELRWKCHERLENGFIKKYLNLDITATVRYVSVNRARKKCTDLYIMEQKGFSIGAIPSLLDARGGKHFLPLLETGDSALEIVVRERTGKYI